MAARGAFRTSKGARKPWSEDSALSRLRRAVWPRARESVAVDDRWCYTAELTVQKMSSKAPCTATLTLGPFQDLYLPVVLEATEMSTDTRSMLRFGALASWDQGGHEERRKLQSTVVTEIGYRDLHELPATLSLPSFLLIPGVLFLIFTRLAAKTTSASGLLEAIVSKGPKALVQVVSFSIVMILLFWLASKGRNLLEGQSLVDVLQLWFWTMGLGALAGGLYRLRKWILASRLADNQPSAADLPGAALRKAIANGSKFALYVPNPSEGHSEGNESKEETFESWHASCWFEVARDGNQRWFAPVIEVEPQPGCKKDTEKFINKLIKLSSGLPFWRRLWRSERAQLAQALIDAEDKSLVYLAWGDQRRPKKVEFDEKGPKPLLQRDTDLRSFFELEPIGSWGILP